VSRGGEGKRRGERVNSKSVTNGEGGEPDPGGLQRSQGFDSGHSCENLPFAVGNRSTDRALVRLFGQAKKPGREDFNDRRFMREEHHFEHHSPKKKRCTGGTLREEWSSHGRGGIGGYLLFCFTREGKPSRGPSSRFVHRKEKRWIRLQTRAY